MNDMIAMQVDPMSLVMEDPSADRTRSDQMHTIKELCAVTQTSSPYWAQKIKNRELHVVRFGKAIRIPHQEFVRILSQGFPG